MKLVSALCFVCCLTFFGPSKATAQFDSMAAKAPWLQYFFARMSPNTPEFSAIGQLEICDPSGTVQFQMPMDLAASTNAFRWETDASQIPALPPQAKLLSKQMRLDKMVFLLRNDEQKVYILYPNLQAYLQVPVSAEALAQFKATSDLIRLQKTPLGRESIDGHPCIKNKVIDAEPNIPPQAGFVWNAIDLQGFPIKTEIQTSQGLMWFNFQQVTTQNPGAGLFQVPAKYTLFKSSADLMSYAKNQASQRNAQ